MWFAGRLRIIYDDDRQETITESGIVIEQGHSRSLVNQANKPITFLSVITPYPKHSRILKLKGPH
ncbi:hypothetical protein [Marinomonas gallaica]|uniref:hypothetical protein n=1 Tax=Marinomonas gallaica TaxID=1806667 RepID=UPI003A94C0FE